jgi:hypothetical protein
MNLRELQFRQHFPLTGIWDSEMWSKVALHVNNLDR